MGVDPESRSLLVVEDEPLLRELVALALESQGFTVYTAATAADARRVFRRADPDGLVLDIDLGAGPNGFDLADVLRREAPHVAIVFLTNLPDPRFAGRDPDGVPSGVAYLRKSALADVDTLVSAIDGALRGATVPGSRHDRDPLRPLADLTRKQIEVLGMVAQGCTNAQIAQSRGVSLKAVEEAIGRMFHALGLSPETDGNLRVAAVRRYLAATEGASPVDLRDRASR